MYKRYHVKSKELEEGWLDPRSQAMDYGILCTVAGIMPRGDPGSHCGDPKGA